LEQRAAHGENAGTIGNEVGTAVGNANLLIGLTARGAAFPDLPIPKLANQEIGVPMLRLAMPAAIFCRCFSGMGCGMCLSKTFAWVLLQENNIDTLPAE